MTTHSGIASSVASWLAGMGLEAYADLFVMADIDLEVLPHLSDDDLVEIGVNSLGHRRKILARIQSLVSVDHSRQQDGERLYLTVVFFDLVGSTKLAECLGEEGFTEVLSQFYQACDTAVERYGGHVAQYHGDGVLVYFGYPTALEDAALRGVLAACDAVDRVSALHTPSGENLQVRVGVASGPVVIGDQQISQNAPTGRAYGIVVNLAARLQSVAGPGQVVLSEATASHVSDAFELISLGQHCLKGIDAPCDVLAVGAQRSSDLNAAMLLGPDRVPFVNRRAELARLSACWNAVALGGFNLVTVAGEHGIGKSRLVAEFLAGLRQAGHPVSHLSCPSHSRETPFQAFRVLLENASDNPQAQDLLDELDSIPSVHLAERRKRRARVIDLLAEHVSQGGQDPHVFWVDDLQWADPSTIEVLLALISRRPPGLLLIASARDGLPDSRITQADGLVPISLGALSPAHTHDIASKVLADVPGAEAILAPLVARADGVPVFAEELALEMRARLLAPDTGAASGAVDVTVPFSLQQSLQARIRRLERARPLLRLVASIGREAPVSLLRELWQETARIEDAMDELVESGLAELKLAHDRKKESHLILRHQILQECAYDIILTRDRTQIHRTIADALDRRKALGHRVEAAVYADQLERAGDLRKATETWAEAGREAARQSADAEAVALYRHALALLPRIAEDTEWAEEFEADTLLAMFPALIGAKGYRAAGDDILNRINALIDRTGGNQRIFSMMFFRWIDIVVQGDIDAGHDFASGLAEIAEGDPTGVQQMVLDRMLGSSHMFRGEFDEALRYLNRFVERYDGTRHAEALSDFGATDNYTTVLCCLAAIQALTGCDETTWSATQDAFLAAEAAGLAHTKCHTLAYGAAFPQALRRNWDAFGSYVEQLEAIATERDLGFWMLVVKMMSGIVKIAQGDRERGQAEFEAGQKGLMEQGFQFLCPTFRVLRALAEEEHPDGPSEDLHQLEQDIRFGERWLLDECERLIRAWS